MTERPADIFQHIPVDFHFPEFARRIRMEHTGQSRKDIDAVLGRALPLLNPKAVYKVSYIGERNQDRITLDNVDFRSKALSDNLQQVQRVFPYVATCGHEVDELVVDAADFLAQFWIDTLKVMALESALRFLEKHIKAKHHIEQLSSMNPGSGEQDFWPIEQQKNLFALFGDVQALIHVRLTDSCLMIPNKSVSGLYFATDAKFETCQFCSRDNCPRRRAPYNESHPQF